MYLNLALSVILGSELSCGLCKVYKIDFESVRVCLLGRVLAHFNSFSAISSHNK